MNRSFPLLVQMVFVFLSALPLLGNSLVGTYSLASTTEEAVAIFLPDGQYAFIQSGEADDGGKPGMETGTYTWDDDTNNFSCTVLTDGNDEWGFSHGLADVQGASLALGPNGITITVPGEGSFLLTRDSGAGASIVGSWWIEDTGVAGSVNEAGGTILMTFLADGSFLFAENGDEVADDSGEDGIESGTYSWNSATGALNLSIERDTNGQWGFSHTGPNPTAQVDASGNFLVFDPDEGGGTVNLHRVVAGSAVINDWAAGLGLSGEDAAPEATPFDDGLPNVMRYALNAGSDPDPEDLPRVSLDAGESVAIRGFGARDIPAGGQELVLSYPQRTPLVGVALVPQVSSDLVTWTDVEGRVAEPLPGDGADITRYVLALPVVSPEEDASAPRFLRLSARVRD